MLALLLTLTITPGPLLFAEWPETVWGPIAVLFFANIMLLVMNVPLVKVLALATGAEIVICGRTTEPVIIAALPLLRGDHAGGCLLYTSPSPRD